MSHHGLRGVSIGLVASWVLWVASLFRPGCPHLGELVGGYPTKWRCVRCGWEWLE